MNRNQEKRIRKMIKEKRRHDISLVHMEDIDCISVFVRDDDDDLGAPAAVLIREDEGEDIIHVEFESGRCSHPLVIKHTEEGYKKLQRFRKQDLVHVVYVNKNADIRQVAIGPNPLVENCM